MRKSIGFRVKFCGNGGGREVPFGGKILISVRICVLFSAIAGIDDDSNCGQSLFGFAMNTGDMQCV